MEEIYSIHQYILDTIKEQGGLEGIALYENSREFYNHLPEEEAIVLKKEIIKAIHDEEDVIYISSTTAEEALIYERAIQEQRDITNEEKERIERFHDLVEQTQQHYDYKIGLCKTTLLIIQSQKMKQSSYLEINLN